MPESLAQTPTAPPSPAHAGEARLSRGWLIAARGAFIAISALALGLLVVAIPLAYQQIITPQTGPHCADSRFSPAQVAALHAAGVSPTSLAVWIIVVQCFQTLVYVGVGALLFWRRSENGVALFAATTLVLLGTTFSDPHWLGASCALRAAWPAAGLLFELLGVVASLLVPAFFYTFPSGRWSPRWGPWLVLCWIIPSLPPTLSPTVVNDFVYSHHWFANATSGLLFATLFIAQIYRYRRISTPEERVQTKWVVLGSGIGLGAVAAIIAGGAFDGWNPTSPSWPLFLPYWGAAIQFCLTLIPISIGIALLRSHLFDVDALINRVLVYGLLTGVLGLLYLGGVIGLQALVRALTGQTSPLIVVISTLTIVVLVQPLRRALQNGIDRRFYRRKYDAARTLAAFGATLRNEVDLERLHADLLAVVQEAMQPVYASLWLRSPSPESPSTPARPLEPAAAWTNRQARADSAELL
jgi:hypothetical protein